MNIHYICITNIDHNSVWYKTPNIFPFSKIITKKRKWAEKNPKSATNIHQFGKK